MGTQTHLPRNIVSPRISATLFLKCCKMPNFILCQEKSYWNVLISGACPFPPPPLSVSLRLLCKSWARVSYLTRARPGGGGYPPSPPPSVGGKVAEHRIQTSVKSSSVRSAAKFAIAVQPTIWHISKKQRAPLRSPKLLDRFPNFKRHSIAL